MGAGLVDLMATGQQMRIDAFAVAVSHCLTANSIPHALLKGPTTSRWLYTPPRPYRDVDILVARTQVKATVQALATQRLATASAGGLGEEASHALILTSTTGLELDLHVTLPLMPPAPRGQADAVWTSLARHLDVIALDLGIVPCLDLPARCVVLALHSLATGNITSTAREDLRRAIAAASPTIWAEAKEIAAELHVADYVSAAIDLLGGKISEDDLPRDIRLLRKSAAGAFQLSRLREAPLSALPGLVIREAFPSPGFMRHAMPDLPPTKRALVAAYAQRIRRLRRAFLSSWRDARR